MIGSIKVGVVFQKLARVGMGRFDKPPVAHHVHQLQHRGTALAIAQDIAFAAKRQVDAGELKAVARTDGKTVGEYKIETADEPCEIVATAENPDWKADGMDLQHIAIKAVDKRGNIHPLASNKLKFKVEGPASLIGVDNGDINSNEMHTGCERSLYCGRALAILRAGRSAGKVKLVIEGENLPKKTVILRLNPAK